MPVLRLTPKAVSLDGASSSFSTASYRLLVRDSSARSLGPGPLPQPVAVPRSDGLLPVGRQVVSDGDR